MPGTGPPLTPAGYLYKRVAARPDWQAITRDVVDIHSVSGCVSEVFADYIRYWRHNGFWLFDSPSIMREIATAEGVDLSAMTLFYYEVHDRQFDEVSRTWAEFRSDEFATAVEKPGSRSFRGYDVATFSQGNTPECSPLSCNAVCGRVDVNEHCLLRSFRSAVSALECGVFDNSEPGPFRVFAVYEIEAADRE